MARPTSPPRLATLILLTGLTVLTLNLFLPSLPGMAGSFGVSEAVIGVAVSGYMIAAALMQVMLGPLSDRVGRRPVLLGALTVYVVASLGCVLVRDVTWFLAFRLLQSSAVAGAVMSSAVIRDLWSEREAASKLGTVAAAMALAPMLGPSLGGVLDAAFGWRASFALFAGLGVAALGLVYLDLGETRPRAALGAPDAGQGRALRPLLLAPLFWAYALCMAFSVGAFYVFISGSPFVATRVFGFNTVETGIGVGAITGGFLMGATLTARLAPRLGIAPLILTGRLVAFVGVGAGLGIVLGGAAGPVVFYAAAISAGFGNGLTIANANAGAMSVVPRLAGTAAGFAGALMLGLGAGLTWITLGVLQVQATPARLLVVMLASVTAALLAALAARWLTRSTHGTNREPTRD